MVSLADTSRLGRVRWWMWRQLIALAFWIAPRGDLRDQTLLAMNGMRDIND